MKSEEEIRQEIAGVKALYENAKSEPGSKDRVHHGARLDALSWVLLGTTHKVVPIGENPQITLPDYLDFYDDRTQFIGDLATEVKVKREDLAEHLRMTEPCNQCFQKTEQGFCEVKEESKYKCPTKQRFARLSQALEIKEG